MSAGLSASRLKCRSHSESAIKPLIEKESISANFSERAYVRGLLPQFALDFSPRIANSFDRSLYSTSCSCPTSWPRSGLHSPVASSISFFATNSSITAVHDCSSDEELLATIEKVWAGAKPDIEHELNMDCAFSTKSLI
jgi:hypothetical protein